MSAKLVVIVTGGSQGIGFAVARDLATRGMCVVIADLVNAQNSACTLQECGLDVCGYEVDVSDPKQVDALVEYTLTEYGAIDALVNNAGIYSSLKPTEFESLALDEWRRVFDVNVLGLFLCCKAVMPAFRTGGRGSIVNISSGAIAAAIVATVVLIVKFPAALVALTLGCLFFNVMAKRFPTFH
ncbi:SDR family NAD(P)-dependent oxidoreductase [Marinobacter sp. tcs-11]|jgi:NAD(P)-dependent dehydrogenase (short-subunit alcohol dehydrogenase family)|uniref:SDR family NAD(P)-dependent oxidoreductase n=1 Tax=Marinobacter sp. tcs-11 TaxID=1742860 RepID=UPI00257F0759|nr:SDR family NAD(P)-dependent oxidoreductase [Marinobacter sp. tcs-11]